MWGDLMKGSAYSAQVKLSKQRGVNQGTPQLPNDEDMGGGGGGRNMSETWALHFKHSRF